MNYRHVYMLIIEHAKKEVKLGLRPRNQRQKKNFPIQYFEFHHILPKSLFPLWVKRKSNIVPLTAREHFFCHQLLTKIYPTTSMIYALFLLCNCKQYSYIRITSREYESLRKNFGLVISKKLKGIKKPWLKGKPFGHPGWNKGGHQSKEWINRRIESCRLTNLEHPENLKWSECRHKKFMEQMANNKEYLSDCQKKGWTKEVKKKLSDKKKEWFKQQKDVNPDFWKNTQKERFKSEKIRHNLSKSKKNKIIYINPITNEKHYFYKDTQPEGYIVYSIRNIKKLNKNETKLAYKKYKANNGILNWNDFQKKLKENKYILNFD